MLLVLAMDELRHAPGNGSHFSAVKPISFTFNARSMLASIDSDPFDQPLA